MSHAAVAISAPILNPVAAKVEAVAVDIEQRLASSLRRHRQARGLTVEQVARAAGMLLATYRAAEAGASRTTPLDALPRLARALGVEVAELLARAPGSE